MITTLRHLVVDSWIGRIIALLIFVAFIGWGANDVFLKPASDDPNVLATVGTSKITLKDFDTRSRLISGRIMAAMGHKPDDTLNKQEAIQLRQIVLQTLLAEYPFRALAKSYGMTVPDQIIRANVFSIPAFQGKNGQFDQARLKNWLRNANLSETAFVNEVRGEVINLALGTAMIRGATASPALANRFADYLSQRHQYDLAQVSPLKVSKKSITITEAELHRFYDNHPWMYRTPEYRHAKIVLLSADTLQQSVNVTEGQIKTLYDSRFDQYNRAESRNFSYLIVKDESAARNLADQWRKGVAWSALSGATADEISDSPTNLTRAAIPSPALAAVAFGATANKVTGPVRGETGWIVLKVSKITPEHHVSLTEARAGLEQELKVQLAAEALSRNVSQLQDAVAGDASMDHIPADLGGRPAQGMLTRDGKTQSGEDAPLPGTEAQKKAMIDAVFSQKETAPPRFVALDDGGAFVVKVDSIEPGRQIPFDEARASVEKAAHDARVDHLNNRFATQVFTAAKTSGGVANIAKAQRADLEFESGLSTSVSAASQTQDALALRILDTKPGETGMTNINGKYYIFTVNDVVMDEGAAHSARKSLRQTADSSLQEDILATLRQDAAKRVGIHINKPLVERVLRGEGA